MQRAQLEHIIRAATGITGADRFGEVHDLAVSKLVAGREKDLDFVGALLRHGLANSELMEQRLASTTLTEERRATFLARLKRLKP